MLLTYLATLPTALLTMFSAPHPPHHHAVRIFHAAVQKENSIQTLSRSKNRHGSTAEKSSCESQQEILHYNSEIVSEAVRWRRLAARHRKPNKQSWV
ncbi:hypothetical protein chiPu_0016014 [Chiloscyllium punctatum]|uniref:Secreted protein n=1 Tax=Chiloscyllium punctatum TaxID=137246 RepID=A0A401T4H9_CHIPU|nr:hypothetical protein [Chiloscyllium punctatum]